MELATNALKEKKLLKEEMYFGHDSEKLVYALLLNEDTDHTKVSFNDNEILVNIPMVIADKWLKGDQNGIKSEQEDLLVVVEKDLKPRRNRA